MLKSFKYKEKSKKRPEKLSIEQLLESNREKSTMITKSSIPSYFNRNFRGIKETPLKSSESLKRFSSPQPSKLSTKERFEEFPKVVQDSLLTSLQSSNGLELYRVIEPSYKYFVGPGNNDSLVIKILKSKPGWSKSFSPHSANLIWTDVKKTAAIDLIPKGQATKKTLTEHKDIENDLLGKEYFRTLATSNTFSPSKIKVYNKLEGNTELSLKKKLFTNMCSFYNSIKDDPFTKIPLTFHVTTGTKDPSYGKVIEKFKEFQENMKNDPLLNNLWIVKPGEATNRGIGIKVCATLDEIAQAVDEKKVKNNIKRTYIVQKYLYRPMLYKNRKFDIRCYVLVTIFNNNIQAYMYKEGYLRTSVSEFSMSQAQDKFIHLTNDAVQKNSPDYGKFEDGNKLSYDEFQSYLDEIGEKANFKEDVYPKIKELVKDSLKATWKLLDPHRRFHCFEVFGYDFMLDELFTPWLIEINTNPCLALSGKYLSTLIPMMLAHSFEVTLDQLFPIRGKLSGNNLYELVFTQPLK